MNRDKKYFHFTEIDRVLLGNHANVVDTIAEFIGPHCEVVLHSLESLDHSVVKIVNGHHTARGLGSPVTDLGMKMLRQYEKTGSFAPKSYFTYNNTGDLIKSTTTIIVNGEQKAIGMLCVNMNVAIPFPDLIKTLIPDASSVTTVETFSASPKELIESQLSKAINEIDNDSSVNKKGRKKAIVKALYNLGIFDLKDATSMVAEELGITRHAIYKYLREFKS